MPGIDFSLFDSTLVGVQTIYTNPVDVQGMNSAAVRFRVTGIIGSDTPTVTVTMEHSNNPYDIDANWETLGTAFSGKTAAGHEDKIFTASSNKMMGFIRGKIAITGTDPAFTGSLRGVLRTE